MININPNTGKREIKEKIMISELNNKLKSELNSVLKDLNNSVTAARADVDDAFKVASDAAQNDDWDAYNDALIIYTERTDFANVITDIRDAAYRDAVIKTIDRKLKEN